MDPLVPEQRLKSKSLRHELHNVQSLPASIEPAVQDPFFTQLQFDKGITAMLAVAGFDSVTASALHSLKALAEEYIVGFLETVCMSMLASRRGSPIPQDFILALAELGIAPSQLEEQLLLQIPKDISSPDILPPAPDEPSSLDLRSMLGSSLCDQSTKSHPQIPSHFPPLPSVHTWRDTQHIVAREKDPRKIRELAAQEGILAEQALRKLAAAANKPRSRLHRTESAAEKSKQAIWQDALAALASEEQSTEMKAGEDVDMTDGADDGAANVKNGSKAADRSAMVINYDRAHWRKGTSFGFVRS
ncbi:hypothetical protein ANO11243_036380 [Dothideomycetidae sp. 11243]|nr:hypothetical protein ANO11243_036380 [fungal sp. No.11243]